MINTRLDRSNKLWLLASCGVNLHHNPADDTWFAMVGLVLLVSPDRYALIDCVVAFLRVRPELWPADPQWRRLRASALGRSAEGAAVSAHVSSKLAGRTPGFGRPFRERQT